MARRKMAPAHNWLAALPALPHNNGMHARFLFGPAGSGKTFRCLAGIREELARAPDGPDLILLAPKQATFQLERQLLADDRVRGYTRLQILSFERLAAYIFGKLGQPLPELLSEEGRVMVLRAILEKEHGNLRVFRASARLAGFARQLSTLLRELQRRRMSPKQLEALAAKDGTPRRLADKLSDLALILSAYFDWIGHAGEAQLEDAPRLLDLAVEALQRRQPALAVGGLWLDGFAEMTTQEQALLAALLPHCEHATLAFCLPDVPKENESWLSPWAMVTETARECYLRVEDLAGVQVEVDLLERNPAQSRFSESPVLANLERAMGSGHNRAHASAAGDQHDGEGDAMADSLRLVECSGVDAEATLAAREILEFVRGGGRYRDCAILVRSLDGYQDVLRRVLTRYGIPFFLDRREPVAHHPLAELTRFALRMVVYDWRREDWLGALKTGLAGLKDYEVDRLENAALARGWEGAALWLQPLPEADGLADQAWLEELRARVTVPFTRLHQPLNNPRTPPTGTVIATLIRALWTDLQVEEQLEQWGQAAVGGSVYSTVWQQMNDWLDNLERAFRDVSLPLPQWLPIIEAGLSGLSVGVIPPALDQVLVGSVDRSRNPDLKFTLVLGVNESVFPAPPQEMPLLSDSDVADLETHGMRVGPGRRQFGHERYLGYIALTRARQRLLVSWSATDAKGHPKNPSRFVDEITTAFPTLEINQFDGVVPWVGSQHPGELASRLLTESAPGLEPLHALPGVRSVLQRWQQVVAAQSVNVLSPGTAVALYGNDIRLSVSSLEQFAACPFQFFAARGLKAQERDEFAVDARRKGEFQHEVLAQFHQKVKASGQRWRELAPDQAAAWVSEIGEQQMTRYQHGLFRADPARAFQAQALIQNLKAVVIALTVWARQNEFEPEAVEVSFGLDPDGWPGWRLELEGGRSVQLRGRVDRVDLLRQTDGTTLVSILDYKSGGKAFDAMKFENGLQLQMPAYLNALCASPQAREDFGATKLIPAGVFYVGLRVNPKSGKSRDEAENAGAKATAVAFQHRGRFDEGHLNCFDNRGEQSGDQFKYRYTTKGTLYKTGNDARPSQAFADLLADTSQQIQTLGTRILDGETVVSPYQHGSSETACGWCKLRSVCRFDSWMQAFRPLKRRVALKDPKEERE